MSAALRIAVARVVAAVAVAVAAPGTAAANPVDAFGFGARGPAMGNAQTAASADASAHYHNPGILATFEEIRMELGYRFADPALEINGGDLNVNRSRGINAGITVPGEFGPVRLAFGGAVFLPDEQVTRTRTLQNDQPRFVLFDNRPQRLFLGANVAVAISDEVFIGAGLGYLSATSGGVALGGRIDTQVPENSDLELAIDVDLKTVRYPQAGVLWRARPWLDLGAAYRGGFVLDVAITFRLEGDIGPEAGPPTVEDGFFQLLSQFQDLFQPEQFAAGASARLTDRLTLAFDVVLHRWSEFDNPAAEIVIDYDLKDLNDLVDLPDAPPLPAAHFHDIVVPHIGIEWLAAQTPHTNWRARAGYIYEPSPVPRQSAETNFVDHDKHTASLGLGLELFRVTDVLPRPVDIDIYAAYTHMNTETTRKVSAGDRIGDYRAGGHILQLGVSSQWKF